MEPWRMLADVSLFWNIPENVLREVADVAMLHTVPRGGDLFVQGDPADTCYVGKQGRLKLTQVTEDGQQIVLRFLSSGDMIGCVACFQGMPYPATASAIVDAEVFGWTTRTMDHLMARHPQIGRNVLGGVSGRLKEIQTRLREVSTERVENRVAHTIVRLAEESGQPSSNGIEIGFPLSRQDVAEMTGTTLHTVSRILSAWERDGLVSSGRQRITVSDLPALRVLAGEE